MSFIFNVLELFIRLFLIECKVVKINLMQTINPQLCNFRTLSRALSVPLDRQCIASTETTQEIKATALLLLLIRYVHECKSVDTMSEQQRKFNHNNTPLK